MRTRVAVFSTALLILATLAVALPAAAEEEAAPSATLKMKSWKIAFIGSAGGSKGTLTYQGKTRKFKMTGLGIGGIGISSSEATGKVYGMKKMDDFIGSYTSGRSGITIGDDEFIKDRMLWLKNEKGVSIQLATEKAGLELNLGADGTVVDWDD